MRKNAAGWGSYAGLKYVSAELRDRTVHLVVDEDARAQLQSIEGCYVVTTDVPVEQASAQTIWDRYGDLQLVKRDFRTMKTTGLQLQPIYLRKANRTRAHAFVTMLALKISRELQRRVAPLGLTTQDALDRLDQKEILDVLPRLPPPRLSLRLAGGWYKTV